MKIKRDGVNCDIYNIIYLPKIEIIILMIDNHAIFIIRLKTSMNSKMSNIIKFNK